MQNAAPVRVRVPIWWLRISLCVCMCVEACMRVQAVVHVCQACACVCVKVCVRAWVRACLTRLVGTRASVLAKAPFIKAPNLVLVLALTFTLALTVAVD